MLKWTRRKFSDYLAHWFQPKSFSRTFIVLIDHFLVKVHFFGKTQFVSWRGYKFIISWGIKLKFCSTFIPDSYLVQGVCKILVSYLKRLRFYNFKSQKLRLSFTRLFWITSQSGKIGLFWCLTWNCSLNPAASLMSSNMFI